MGYVRVVNSAPLGSPGGLGSGSGPTRTKGARPARSFCGGPVGPIRQSAMLQRPFFRSCSWIFTGNDRWEETIGPKRMTKRS